MKNKDVLHSHISILLEGVMKAQNFGEKRTELNFCSWDTPKNFLAFLKTHFPKTYHVLSSAFILLGDGFTLRNRKKTSDSQSQFSSSAWTRIMYEDIPAPELQGISMAQNTGEDISVLEKMLMYQSEQTSDETLYHLQGGIHRQVKAPIHYS
jgi:hypothetical protein